MTTQAAAVPTMVHKAEPDASFVRFELPPGGRVELNRVFHETVVVLAFVGSVWSSRQGGRTYLEVPGSVVLRDAGEVFDTRTLDVDPVRGSLCREIHLEPRQMAAQLAEAGLALDFGNAVIANRFLYEHVMATHAAHEDEDCSLLRSSSLASLVLTLAEATVGRAANLPNDRRHTRVVDYLRSNYDRPITLQELAEVAEANPFVLLRQFKRDYGVTPHEYLRVHRVNRARDYIRKGHRLADVAALCGFADQSHLNRQFKRTVGVTPGRFFVARDVSPA